MQASALTHGMITHKRYGATPHTLKFAYWGLVLDLNRINTDFKALWPVKAGLCGFRGLDHGTRNPSQDLRSFALQKWQDAGLSIAETAKVFLSCFPRQGGYVFNPLSVYWAWEGDRLTAVLFEVRNTVGGMHHYAFEPQKGVSSAHKVFYVSPFIDGEQSYTFKVTGSADHFTVRIDVADRATHERILTATQTASLSPLSAGSLIKHTLRRPLQSYAIMAQILWHALILKLRGAPYHPPSQAHYVAPKASNEAASPLPDTTTSDGASHDSVYRAHL